MLLLHTAIWVLTLTFTTTAEVNLPLTQEPTVPYSEILYTSTDGLEYSDSSEEQKLLFDPPDSSVLTVHNRIYVQVNLSQKLDKYVSYYSGDGSTFYLGVKYNRGDSQLANMINIIPAPKVLYRHSKPLNLSYHLFWRLQINGTRLNGFLLGLASIGYPQFEVHLVEKKYNISMLDVIHREVYHLTLIRKHRTVDDGFTVAITVVGILNIFAIGCMTEIPVLRSQLKKSIIPVCIASATQYIITPLLVFGLVKASKILPEIGIGMLLCACVPGGGLGHLIVLVTGNANTELSVVINVLQIFVPLGMTPLWLYSLNKFLKNGVGNFEVPTHYIVVCLALLLIPYIVGVLIKHLKPSISDAILNWLIKPLLLLFMILFITLGLYINIYAMGVLDKVTLIVAGLIPCLGFCIGGGATLLTKQGKASAKSVAIEAAIMNCLAVVATFKYTMTQPDSDMACAGAIAVLFFTPLPFIGMLIFHKIKKKIMNYFENRRYEKEHHETISKSFGVITQNALRLSGMTPNQINARRDEEERIENMDKTLLSDELDSDEAASTRPSVVQLKVPGDDSVETVSLTQTNNRNYL